MAKDGPTRRNWSPELVIAKYNLYKKLIAEYGIKKKYALERIGVPQRDFKKFQNRAERILSSQCLQETL